MLVAAEEVLVKVLAARDAAVAAMQDNIEAKDAAVYIASMVVELARARMDMKRASTEEESVEAVRAAGERIDEMRRTEKARRAAREAARQEAMASEEAARTVGTRAGGTATRTARVGRIATRTARVRSIAARAVGTRAARVRAFWARAVGTRAVGTREAAAREEGGSSDEEVVEGR